MPETVQPLVSVLIPTYNQREYIVKAIESALQQDYEPLEVIVGDDCSSDGTKALVMSTFSDTRLKYFRNEVNIGRVANYRATLSRATGDWAINLDGDDYFTNPSYIRKAVDRARTREDIALVFGRRYTDSEGRVDPDARAGRNEKLRDVMDGNEVFLALADYSIVINHMTCLYRRKLAGSLSFYRLDIISADWESIYRMVIGRKVGFIDEYCGAWRRHGANASRSFNERGILNNYQLCTSLRDAAAGSGLFSSRQLSRRSYVAMACSRRGLGPLALSSGYLRAVGQYPHQAASRPYSRRCRSGSRRGTFCAPSRAETRGSPHEREASHYNHNTDVQSGVIPTADHRQRPFARLRAP